jgi:MoxR-like ATPase
MVPVPEREHLRVSLAEYAGDCRADEGRLMLVSGEAGVGKTTLLERFAAAAGRRAPTPQEEK